MILVMMTVPSVISLTLHVLLVKYIHHKFAFVRSFQKVKTDGWFVGNQMKCRHWLTTKLCNKIPMNGIFSAVTFTYNCMSNFLLWSKDFGCDCKKAL